MFACDKLVIQLSSKQMRIKSRRQACAFVVHIMTKAFSSRPGSNMSAHVLLNFLKMYMDAAFPSLGVTTGKAQTSLLAKLTRLLKFARVGSS